MSLFSQTEIFTQDFEDEDMTGWLTDDLDGDGNFWELVFSSEDAHQQGWGPDMTLMLGSFAYDVLTGEGLSPDNVIATPQIDLPEGEGIELSFKTGTLVNYMYNHNLAVYIVDDYTGFDESWTPIADMNLEGVDTAMLVILNLSEYAGNTIRVVFRHYNSADQFVLLLDDISITQKVADEVEVFTDANPVEGGEISGGGMYPINSTATLVATPNSGFVFDKWTENGQEVSSDQEYSFIVEESRTLTAQFQIINSVDEVSDNSNLFIFPNPVMNIVNIKSPIDILEIKIFNPNGKLILTKKGDKTIDLSVFETGLYLFEIHTIDGIVRRKVIKESKSR